MEVKTFNIAKIFNKAISYIELNRLEKAKDQLNMGLGLLGKLTIDGVTQIDSKKVDSWKQLFWKNLESIDGLDDGGELDSVSEYEIGLIAFKL